MRRHHVIIALAALAGLLGELLAAVSTTRIAGPVAVELGQVAGRLGFPYDLRWTLFGVISVAGWVGAILWTSSDRRDRRVGPWLNLPASTGAGVIVGLDHATHADPSGAWPVLAFLIGPAITLTSSAMLHVISRMLDRAAEPAVPTSHRTAPSGVRSGDSPNFPGGDGDSGTYKADEGGRTTAEPEPSDDLPPTVAAGRHAIDEQIRWINTQDVEPSAEDIAERYSMSPRTAFRRIEAARKARGAA